MCMKILQNKDWYMLIPRLAIEKMYQKLYLSVDNAYLNNIINKTIYRLATLGSQLFFSLPKVHKDIKNPPGRPIVSGQGGKTENLSRFIDEQLRPLARNPPSYIRDLLQNLKSFHITSAALLVTVDFEALYRSIQHQQGIKVINHFLSQSPRDDKEFHEFILTSLK